VFEPESLDSPRKGSIKLSWNKVSVSFKMPKKKKEIKLLDIAPGCIEPGKATYLMGTSGSGKTSFLNFLADRLLLPRGATIEGEVLFNDKTKVD